MLYCFYNSQVNVVQIQSMYVLLLDLMKYILRHLTLFLDEKSMQNLVENYFNENYQKSQFLKEIYKFIKFVSNLFCRSFKNDERKFSFGKTNKNYRLITFLFINIAKCSIFDLLQTFKTSIKAKKEAD